MSFVLKENSGCCCVIVFDLSGRSENLSRGSGEERVMLDTVRVSALDILCLGLRSFLQQSFKNLPFQEASVS